ncbi:hypothetical protein DM860_001948 [Cuscuta australis]|uniref:Uncharacterized protein n=1 Tax=Cuscuta australis TaxID=267555 RepID=A0A328DVB1_9ASTE|nr:hypothetical protein DM860_001948 [Cuscuta australis]
MDGSGDGVLFRAWVWEKRTHTGFGENNCSVQGPMLGVPRTTGPRDGVSGLGSIFVIGPRPKKVPGPFLQRCRLGSESPSRAG